MEDGNTGGRQIVGVAVTVTVDTEQVPVAVVEVAHVFEEDCAAFQVLVVLGDVVADDLAGLLCEVVLPGDVVLLGTLTVVDGVTPMQIHPCAITSS